MNWPSIKAHLRISSEQLDMLENIQADNGESIIPVGILVKYQDVQNVTAATLNKVSRKHVRCAESVKNWMTELREKNYETYFKMHPSPSLVTGPS